jgi:acetyltransferase-like isoleucine patch superfamily enzyme
VCLLTGSHDLSFSGKQRAECVISGGRDIVIEEGVWLTSNVTVIGPCVIGKNSVVLPGSVVNDNIPPNSVFGGIPARLVRMLEPETLP